jgi:hypothetical protein
MIFFLLNKIKHKIKKKLDAQTQRIKLEKKRILLSILNTNLSFF